MHYTLLRSYVMFRGTRPFLQSFRDAYCLICLALSSLGVSRRPCVSPFQFSAVNVIRFTSSFKNS